MIGRAGQWTQTPSTTPLQTKKWNACFWIVFTSDDQLGWLMDSNPIHHPSSAKKWNAHFWITFNFWWSAGLVHGLKLHPPPISSQKNEMLIFGLRSTSDDQPGWFMDSNPICHPSPAQKMKCSFLDYAQCLMIGRAGRWTQTPSTIPLQMKKNKMLIFGLCWTSDDRPGWSMDSNPICHPSPAKKIKCSFFDYVQLLMISQAGWWTQTPSSTSLQPKIEILIFGICSTSDGQPGWFMDSNPIHHPSPAKKWNAHFWNMFNFWWSARLVNCLKSHPPPLFSQKKWNAHFWIAFNFWCWLGWSMDSEPHLPPICSQTNEMLIFGLYSTSTVGQAGWWNWTPSATPLQPNKWNACFWITFTSDDQMGWLMDSNPIHHPSPAKKMKCLVLDYVQLLMIGRAGGWTQTSSPLPSLQPKNWNAHIWIMFNFWWSAGLVNGLKPHLQTI